MASIARDKNGRKRILFVADDGSRKTIRLGKASMKQAEAFKIKLEALIAERITGNIDAETARWVAELGDNAHARLAAVGLVKPRASLQLGEFLDEYIKSRDDVKPGTATVYGHTRRNLIDFFGSDKPLRDMTEGDAEQWRLFLIRQGLSDNTVRRRCGMAKQFLRAALKHKLVACNPFSELKSSVKGNKAREYFVSREEAQKVLDACPDSQWRLIFALARYGGLRCPSEILALKWSDVDWERGRMLIHSPKTEHHEGRECRMVPLFPELVPYLREVFEQAEPGTEYVITRYGEHNSNLRTQFQRIIHKAGLKPWPKLFQNLRSTRETELAERWPEHVVCAWIGHSRVVARKHYLQVTDEHFEQAAQNAAQYSAEREGTEQNDTPGDTLENAVLRCDTAECGALQEAPVGDTGLEPVTSRV